MNIERQGFHTNPERINRNGRPKKYTTHLKAIGYSQSEIDDCIRVLLSLTEAELEECINDQKATILELTLAKSLQKSMQRGSLDTLQCLLDRTFGRPKNTTQVSGIEPVTLVFTPYKEGE